MTEQLSGSLGLLMLDHGQADNPARLNEPGSIQDPATVGCPILTEIPEGADGVKVCQGDLSLTPAYIAAARRLVERGAVAISSNCGFTIRYQEEVAAAVNIPVALSSMLLLPLLLKQVPQSAKIAILTYDTSYFDEELLGLSDPAERARIVLGGLEGTKYWHDELKHPAPPTDVGALEKDAHACITRLRESHPEIAAILFECAGFPPITSAIRRLTGLPVYDIANLCRMMMGSISQAGA
ncbi:hypothetical protein [Ensifer aridi]|uniref:hypothetical protein n=1 Tax=Ensifer aridi TaxID=1708715 RepID=UPI00358F2593